MHRDDDPLPLEDRLRQAHRAGDFLFKVRGFDGFAREAGLDQSRAQKGNRGLRDLGDFGRVQTERCCCLGRRVVGKINPVQNAAPERRKIGHRPM